MTGMRTCATCGKEYPLLIPYEKANPKIRDLCVDCIEEMIIQAEERADV